MTFPSPIPYAEDTETIPADEADDIQRVLEAMTAILSNSQASSGQFRADVHVKTHGYARGEFRVLPNLTPELAQGLFTSDRVYPAVVRFSNSASQPQADAMPDGRGLAIKVLDVQGPMLDGNNQQGPTQDFLAVNHPVFFARNVKDFLRLEQVRVESGDQPLATLQGALTGGDWNPLHWHWREMFAVARIGGKFPAHPGSPTYFSMVPIRFGDHVAKYRVKPVGDGHEFFIEQLRRLATQGDAMRIALEETLRQKELLFELQIQLRTSERTMPVEDACVWWPESESGFRMVAQLVLPRQEIAPLREQPDFQRLSFQVWQALAAHRPLGGINRLRRRVYPLSVQWRNHRPQVENELPATIIP